MPRQNMVQTCPGVLPHSRPYRLAIHVKYYCESSGSWNTVDLHSHLRMARKNCTSLSPKSLPVYYRHMGLQVGTGGYSAPILMAISYLDVSDQGDLGTGITFFSPIFTFFSPTPR